MYDFDLVSDPDASSHLEEEQTETTEIFPQYAPPPLNSNASAGLAPPEEIQPPPSARSSLPVPKPANVEPTDIGPASRIRPNIKPKIRIRDQEAGPLVLVESRTTAMKEQAQTYWQAGASSHPRYHPIGGISERGQPSMEIVDNSYNFLTQLESGSNVLENLISFVSGKLFNRNTSDHDKRKCQQLAYELRNKLVQTEMEQSRMVSHHQQEVSRLKQDIQWYAEEESRLQKKANTLEENNAKLHERCNKFDDHLRVIQGKSLRRVSNGRWLAQDDLNTYATLRSLRDQIKAWAVKFSIKNLQELDYLNGEDRQEDFAKLKSYLGSILMRQKAQSLLQISLQQKSLL